MADRKLVVRIVGDSASLERAFKRSNTASKGFGSSIGTLGKVAGVAGGLLGAAGLGSALRASFSEMIQGQKVAAQTNAVLKSTGGVANVTAKQVDALSQTLLAKSGVDDEVIKSGENMLLTFRGIKNEVGAGNNVFDQASRAILDMDTAMTHGNVTQENLSKTAILVGKALQDPVKGFTALRRVGVQLTQQQEDQIKAFIKSGDTLSAQKLILRELNKEFGGSAAAIGGTLPGKINILRETLLNLGATLTTNLAPALTRIIDRLNKWLGNTENQKRIQEDFRQIVSAVASVFKTLASILEQVNRVTGGLGNTVKILIGTFVAFKALNMAASVTQLAGSFGLLGANAKGAAGASALLKNSLVGKAGLVVGAGVAAFAITTLALKVTGLDKKLKNAGGAAFDLAANLGLVNDKGKQFEGKTILTPQASRFIRQRAARLEAGGLTPAQAAAAIEATHPNVAKRDIEVLAGVFGARPIVVHTHINLDGREIATNTTKHQQRAGQRRAVPRRGPYAGKH